MLLALPGIFYRWVAPSLINLDFADVRAIMHDAGTAVINLGYGHGSDRVDKAIKSTLNHPMLDVDLEGAKSAMVARRAGIQAADGKRGGRAVPLARSKRRQSTRAVKPKAAR